MLDGVATCPRPKMQCGTMKPGEVPVSDDYPHLILHLSHLQEADYVLPSTYGPQDGSWDWPSRVQRESFLQNTTHWPPSLYDRGSRYEVRSSRVVQTTASYVTRMTSEESWTNVEPVGWLETSSSHDENSHRSWCAIHSRCPSMYSV